MTESEHMSLPGVRMTESKRHDHDPLCPVHDLCRCELIETVAERERERIAQAIEAVDDPRRDYSLFGAALRVAARIARDPERSEIGQVDPAQQDRGGSDE